MKIYYDPEHKMCEVEFDKEEGLFLNVSESGGISITNYHCDIPIVTEKQLAFSLEELKKED